MKKIVFSFIAILIYSVVIAQAGASERTATQESIKRPKLVVGIVVDQMRWDYLYRYYDRYKPNGGFKRLLNQGFSCENTLIPYTPTYTACGHTCIYTGSVPAIHGITGNSWWDSNLNREVYCTEDDSVKTVGSNKNGQMSPRNLLATTICDELKLATNFRSKVTGIALKDRGGILPAGQSADAAYWYDNQSGDWISSTYYMTDLPQWVKDFNAKKLVDKYYNEDWNTLYPLNTYRQSTDDEKSYEIKPFGSKGFPYNLKQFAGKNYNIIDVTPYGNTFTFEMAKAGLIGGQLGADSITDFLAISVSPPDYVGHSFGPNSIEAEDTYLRLDLDLGDFLNFLDEKVGKGQWLLFLSADHGVAHVPDFLKEHKISAGHIDSEKMMEELNNSLKEKFGQIKLVVAISNYQVFLNHTAINDPKLKLDEKAIRSWILDYLMRQPGIARVVELDALSEITLPATIKEALANSYYPPRSGDIQLIYKPQWIEGFVQGGTTHGSWDPYDAHIPLLWYGWNIRPGKTNREIYMTDIAPSISALLHIQMPSGSIGHVIEEIVK